MSRGIVVLGNAPSLNKKFLDKYDLFKNDIVIACNHFYLSGITPTYLCISDVNFFVNSKCSPEKLFKNLKTTFVITEKLFELYRKYFDENSKVVICDVVKGNGMEYPKFPTVLETHGTLTTLSFPLAFELLKQNSHLNRCILVIGVDQKQEKLHFYKEPNLNFEEINRTRQRLGRRPMDWVEYRQSLEHDETTKQLITLEFQNMKSIFEKNNYIIQII